MKKEHYIAIDLGGTKIYTVLACRQKGILAETRLATQADAGPDALMEQLVSSVKDVLEKAGCGQKDISAAAVCVAGFFDWQDKILVSAPNLPGMNGLPLEEMLRAKLGVEVLAENDANAAALGEARLGAGRGCSDLVFVTVSTGIGAGLITGGRIYRGGKGFAGELGHMAVKHDGELCGCGRRGCLETVSSGTAIAREAKKAVEQGIVTILGENKHAEITAPDVFAAAAKGDAVALSIIKDAADCLGIGLVNVVNLLNPELIVIGGGVAEAGESFLSPLRQTIASRAVIPAARSVKLRKAQLGVRAGVLGLLCLLEEDGQNSSIP